MFRIESEWNHGIACHSAPKIDIFGKEQPPAAF